ncbi:MAG: transglycosylase SLT domain-containing protein [Deltaproteobacteria bacterium]|nr:transglycosylase SLT domain-containing protein [Deltaproteobacteria bacterium]
MRSVKSETRNVRGEVRPSWLALASLAHVLTLASSVGAQTQTSSLADVRSALVANDGPRAEAAIAALDPEDARALPEYLAFFRARAAMFERRANDAILRLDTIAKTLPDGRANPLYDDAAELRAEALVTLGKPAEAASVLLSLDDEARRLLRAMELDKSAGGTGRQALERLVVGAPESAEAQLAMKRLGRESLLKQLSVEARAARVRKLLDQHQNADAALEARLLNLDGAAARLRCEMEFIEGKALRKLRKYRASMASLATARRLCAAANDDDTELRASLLEAQVQNISRSAKELERLVASMSAKSPRHGFIDDAIFLLAESQDQRGQRSAALASYQRVVDEFPAGDMAPTAAWRLALDAIKRGETDRAHEALKHMTELGDDVARARTRYWLARTYAGTDPTTRCRLFSSAVEEPALTFYAFLALDRLGREDPSCAEALRNKVLRGVMEIGAKPPSPPSIETAPARDRARRLGAAGFFDLAEAELDLLSTDQLVPDEIVALALAYAEIQAHQKAQWLLRTRASPLLRALPNRDNAWVWRTAYSRPYLAEMEDAAIKSKIEPLLLQALSREESTFDPDIVSWAGAVGLAQLMPATAIGAYAELRMGRLDLARLTEPALNLRLGGHVLADGLKQFQGSVPLALSAYNGGAGLTRRVLPAKASDFDLWVETIPVKETRGYVGRVSGTWGVYRLLYDPKSPFIDLPDQVPAG